MSPRRLLGMLVLVAVVATGCGAGTSSETDKERATPYLAGVSAGQIAVRAVRVVLAAGNLGATSPSAAPTAAAGAGPQAYLLASFVNRGSATDSLTSATIGGGAAQADSGATLDLALPPQQLVQLGEPDLELPGTAISVGALGSPLVLGTTTPVTLTFRDAGTVTVQAPILTSDQVGTTASAQPVTAGG